MSSNVRNMGLALPIGPSSHERVFAEMSAFPLWYNRFLEKPAVPSALAPYVSGTRYLSTKQVPSCLILRCAGSQTVSKNRELLLKTGFQITEDSRIGEESRDLTVRRTIEGLVSPAGSLAELLSEASRVSDILNQGDGEHLDSEYDHSGSETEDTPTVLEKEGEGVVRFRKNCRYRIKYDDPWKIHAGRQLGSQLGYDPKTVMWSGDGIRLQDPLPSRVLGPNWTGSAKSKVRFSQIADIDVKLHVIYAHTHWGSRLRTLCNEPNSPYRSWARTLRTRLNRFLRGSTDPCMSKAQIEALFESTEASPKARSDRLIELLKTVDGIFLQRYLAYPEEVWTWERFDMFTLGNLSYLIGDEFLDGEMREAALDVTTAYSQLKASRKWFKMHSHRGTLKQALEEMDKDVPHWCRQFVNVWKRSDCSTGPRRTYLIGLLSQTRGCGTPPPLVLLQSKMKFLRIIGKEPSPQPETYRALRRAALFEVINELPEEAFTGLRTKARVSVTTASSWEKTRREGGTIEAAREILASLPVGESVPVRDLDTGRIECYRDRSAFDSTGEVIFWLALDHVLRTPPDLLKQAFLTVVKEPGKARSVTKARACLKIVLDLVNKIVSVPLEKGIRSSASGMGKANHGWNLFCRLMSDDVRELVFNVEAREENPYEGYVERTDTFANLYMSSTDYEQATDQMLHEVASDAGQAWMRKCGIPRLLRGIVAETCFKPREVFFYATGALKTIGTERPDMGVNIRSVRLVRGVLMGDPLTKVVLHLTNVVTRRLAERLHNGDFYDKFPNGMEAFGALRSGLEKSRDSPLPV